MDNLLCFLEKHKYGLLASFATYMFIFIYLHLQSYNEKYEIENYSAQNLRDSKTDEEVSINMENIKLASYSQKDNSINTVKNLNDQRTESETDWSEDYPIELDRQNYKVEDDQELNASKEHLREIQNSVEERNNKVKLNEKEDNTQKTPTVSSSSSVKGSVLVSYNVPNRKSIRLSIPGYSCKSAGRIAIKVTVDMYGDVINAKFDASQSSSNEPCMVELAKNFAKQKSRFNKSSKSDSGWIYYTFEAQ